MKEVLEYKNKKAASYKAFFYFAGWGIGLASLLLAVYSEFIKKDEPRMEYDIISSTTFINKNETAANLRIFIDSLDIQKKDLNITAFNIKVSNKGTAPIRYNDYDQGFFGLKIRNGSLLEPPTLIEESVSQIKELFPKSDSILVPNTINVPALSLDVDDYYIMHIVLLHSADSIPAFRPEGRIIGQKEIPLNTLKTPLPSFWSLVFIGDWTVHLVRLLIYMIVVIISALIAGLSFSEIEKYYNKVKRKRFAAKIEKKDRITQLVKDDFVEYGVYFINQLKELYDYSEKDLSSQYKRCKEIIEKERPAKKKKLSVYMTYKHRYNKFLSLANKGYLKIIDDDSVVVNKDARRSIQILYSRLKSEGLMNSSSYSEVIAYDESFC